MAGTLGPPSWLQQVAPSSAWSGCEWHELTGTVAVHSWPSRAPHSTACLLGLLFPLRQLLSCPQLSPLVRERCSPQCRSSGSLGEPRGASSPAAAPQEQLVRACGAVPGDSRPLLAGCGPVGAPHRGPHLTGPAPCRACALPPAVPGCGDVVACWPAASGSPLPHSSEAVGLGSQDPRPPPAGVRGAAWGWHPPCPSHTGQAPPGPLVRGD